MDSAAITQTRMRQSEECMDRLLPKSRKLLKGKKHAESASIQLKNAMPPLHSSTEPLIREKKSADKPPSSFLSSHEFR